MRVPHGPYKISQQRQVTVPREVMEAVGLRPGDFIHYEVGGDRPGCILVVPTRLVSKWYAAGQNADDSDGSPDT